MLPDLQIEINRSNVDFKDCVLTRSDAAGSLADRLFDELRCAGSAVHPIGNRSHDVFLIGFGEVIVKWKSKEAVADIFGDGAIPSFSSEALSHAGEVQRQIMKDTVDPMNFQMRDQFLLMFCRRHQKIEHVVGLLAVRRHRWETEVAFAREALKMLEITIPDALTLALNDVVGFELSIEKCGQHVGWQVT